jgi:LacI family transcriptional regulator
MVTQSDVAAAAGVSVMTVSLALRNRPEVAQSTATRVRQWAEKLGYRPDPALSALVHHRRGRARGIRAGMALLTAWETRNEWQETPVGGLAWEGARRRAEEYGYRIEHFWLGRDAEHARRVSDVLMHRGIRGAIIAPMLIPWREIAFPWERFAVVTLERNADFPSLPHVSPNHYADLLRAWDHLLGLGYRRIGLATFSWLSERNQRRWEAAQLIRQNAGLARADRVPTLVVPSGPHSVPPVAAVDRWITRHRPEVVLSPSPEFRRAILESGRAIPRDVAFASLQRQLEDDGVAGINQHRDKMGAACVDALHARLLRSDYGVPDSLSGTTIDGDWVDGPSAPRRGRL